MPCVWMVILQLPQILLSLIRLSYHLQIMPLERVQQVMAAVQLLTKMLLIAKHSMAMRYRNIMLHKIHGRCIGSLQVLIPIRQVHIP